MNNPIVLIIIAIVCAYIIGSIPSGYIMGRLRKGVDIRQIGSHSMGAMNVFYQIGFVEGLTVLATDIGKGVAAVALARWLGVPLYAQLLAAAAVVIGHAFTVFLKFRGGRQLAPRLSAPKPEGQTVNSGGPGQLGVCATFSPSVASWPW